MSTFCGVNFQLFLFPYFPSRTDDWLSAKQNSHFSMLLKGYRTTPCCIFIWKYFFSWFLMVFHGWPLIPFTSCSFLKIPLVDFFNAHLSAYENSLWHLHIILQEKWDSQSYRIHIFIFFWVLFEYYIGVRGGKTIKTVRLGKRCLCLVVLPTFALFSSGFAEIFSKDPFFWKKKIAFGYGCIMM